MLPAARLRPAPRREERAEPRRAARPRQRWGWAVAPATVAAAVGAATTLLALVDPAEPGHYPGCPILALIGLYCPGCGGLRAVHALARHDLRQALDLNALLVVAIPFLAAGYAAWVRARWRGRGCRSSPPTAPGRSAYWLTGVIFTVMLIFGVLRNLPALAWLAP